jgi:hypothetical protein
MPAVRKAVCVLPGPLHAGNAVNRGRLTLDEAKEKAESSGIRHAGYCAMPHPTVHDVACFTYPEGHALGQPHHNPMTGRDPYDPLKKLSWEDEDYA